jgi:hypothetical protein
MNGPLIVPIVEGHGEVEAVPRLIHRIYAEFSPGIIPKVNPAIRVKAGSFLNDPDYFQRQISLAASKAAQNNGRVLILLDCEDVCPAILGPDLLSRAIAVRSDIPYSVVLAHREFETWFIAALNSLGGRAGIALGAFAPPDAEAIRGAKEWLGKQMSQSYDPIVHQLEFSKHFDLHQARRIPSFNRLIQKLVP